MNDESQLTMAPWWRTPAVGGVFWFTWAAVVQPEWTAVLLLLSPFVLLPLGLRLAAGYGTGPDAPALRTLGGLAPAVALTAAASFVPGPGLMAAVISLPWLCFTVLVALNGAGRVLSRRTVREPAIAVDAGLLFLAVGGAWLTISRAGLNPLGFSDAIVQLTAVHFHYAGFALPIVAGFVSTRLKRSALDTWVRGYGILCQVSRVSPEAELQARRSAPKQLGLCLRGYGILCQVSRVSPEAKLQARRSAPKQLVPLSVTVGVPLTAVGITVGGWLEWVAATVMALAGLATAALLIRLGLEQRRLGRWLTVAAGAALAGGMSMALGWSWSIRFGWNFLDLESMAATHGSLNALGFGLLGLIGLNLIAARRPGMSTTAHSGAMSVHIGRPSAEHLNALAGAAYDEEPTSPAGLLDRPTRPGFRRKSWHRVVDHGSLAATAEALRQWRGHEAAGIVRSPAKPEITIGETLALVIPVGPISVTATSRITKVIDEPDRFGFVYSTLPHHPQDGEESFIVTENSDGAVVVTVTAVWRPATIAARICPPLTSYLQNQAIQKYLDGTVAIDGRPVEVAR